MGLEDVNNNLRNIGELIYSAIPMVDSRVHLLDGSLISGNGIYADFVNYMKSIYTEDSPYFYHDKYVSTKFVNPTLGYYNMIGGDKFAVFADQSYNYGASRAKNLFDPSNDNYWRALNSMAYFVFYAPIPIKVRKIMVGNVTANYGLSAYSVYGSNDGKTWTPLLENATNASQAAADMWTMTINSTEYYKYHKVQGATPAAANEIRIKFVVVTSTYKNENGEDVDYDNQYYNDASYMTDDYPTGLDKFGVYVSSTMTDSSYQAWRAFDKNSADANCCLWRADHTTPQKFYFYNPIPINVKSITILSYNTRNLKTVELYGFNESTLEWDYIGVASNDTVNTNLINYTLDYHYNENFYNTYRMNITEWTIADYCGIREMTINAYNYPELKTAEDQYFEDLAKTGCAGKFVYNKENNTIRLPKLSGKVPLSISNDHTKIGELSKAFITSTIDDYYNINYNLISTNSAQYYLNNVAMKSMNYYLYIVLANSIDTTSEAIVNIGKITNELNSKIGRSELAEASVVIESYQGDYSWYRLYSDGWVEQGGIMESVYSAYTVKTITFLKPFRSKNYIALFHSGYTADLQYPAMKEKNPEYVTFAQTYNSTGCANWYACGYAATEEE